MQIGLIRQVKALFFKELKIEWRNRYAINGIIVQLLSSVFICYLLFQHFDDDIWNALFLVIIVFAGTNAIARSFTQESQGRLLYYHTLAHPLALFFAKVLLNALLTLMVALLAFLSFNLLLGSGGHSGWQFPTIIALFCLGIGMLFSSVAAIVAKTKGGNLLMPVLSFPLVIPLLLVSISAMRHIDTFLAGQLQKDMLVLALIDLMILVLGSLLYKFVWQE